MQLSCELCEKDKFPFLITFCRTHPEQILIVSTKHKDEFDQAERAMIQKMFPEGVIRWEQQSVKDHAHCHVKLRGN